MTPKITEAPEVSLAVGVDKVAKQVTLDFESSNPEGKPFKIRVHFAEKEVSDLCKALVTAAVSIRQANGGPPRQVIVLPTKDSILDARRR